MPTYTYVCKNCNEQWDEIRRISDRGAPTTEPCPKCGELGSVNQAVVSINISHVSEATKSINKVRSSKFAEKLQQIHDKTPGSTLDKTSNIVHIK